MVYRYGKNYSSNDEQIKVYEITILINKPYKYNDHTYNFISNSWFDECNQIAPIKTRKALFNIIVKNYLMDHPDKINDNIDFILTDEVSSELNKSAEEKTKERRIKAFENRDRLEKLSGVDPTLKAGLGTRFQGPDKCYNWNDGSLK